MRFSTVFSSASALLFAASALAQNAIVNPNFENGLDGWTVSGPATTVTVDGITAIALGSGASAAPTSSASDETSTDVATSTASADPAEDTAAALVARATPMITLTQNVPGLTPGTNYKVTFKARVSYSDNNPNGDNFGLTLKVNNGASDETYALSGTYDDYTQVFTSIDGTDTFMFTFMDGPYTIYLTEVIVTAMPTGSQAVKSRKRRDLAARLAESQTLCPAALTACPIVFGLVEQKVQVSLSAEVANSEYECLDVQTELNSCGGCSSTGKGVDCEALPFVGDVQCVLGACLVYSCEAGFNPSSNMTMCEVSA